MKIVCEACQAKYSIADDKVRGKVFKIRCKKCSHVIVVRGSGEVATPGGPSNEFAAAPNSAADLALDAGWHIVVDGEQVGPLSEADVRARLSRSEITPDTYIWREGLADWVKVSTLPEFSGGAEPGSPFPEGAESGPFEQDGPTAVAPPSADPFGVGAPGGGGGGGGGVPAIAELFAAPLPGSDNATTTVSNSPGFGAFDPHSASEAAYRGSNGGNGAMGVGMVQPSGLTGQRHENSVLFSLANLEALAKPASMSMPLPRGGASPVSSSTTTEGSGLIDIRAMANMTLGGAAKSDSRNDDLPAFSAPQFSPVAPVLLPMGSTGTPRWAIVVLSVLGLAIVALGIVVVKIFTSPPAAPPVAQAPVPAPPPPAATRTAPPTSAQPPSTPPPEANENLPPREPSAQRPAGATAAAGEGAAGERPGARARQGGRRSGAAGRNSAPLDRSSAAVPPPPPARPVAEAPRKPKDDIEALLEAASGNRRNPPPARREAEEPAARAPAAEKAPPLDREEIVKGMNAVMPRARECYNQYKVPGVATVKITVSPAGRVSDATVTGRFAGTPSGSCVESALKTARFPPSAGRAFDYVVPLR